MNTSKSDAAKADKDDVKENLIFDLVKSLVQKTSNMVLAEEQNADTTATQVPKPNEILEKILIGTQTQNYEEIAFNASGEIVAANDFDTTAEKLKLLSMETVTDKVEEYLRQCKSKIATSEKVDADDVEEEGDDDDFLLPHEDDQASGDNNMAPHDFDDVADESYSEGACALPAQVKEMNTQCDLDELKPETIKYTTPQETDDSDDQSVRGKQNNNNDNNKSDDNANDLGKPTINLSHIASKHVPQLVYFNVRGIGEPLRLLFAYCKITYHDVRLTRDEWHELKNSIPNCQIPMLVIGDTIIQHVVPIARYLGTLGGLNGNTALEAMEIDGVVETLNEFRHQILQSYYELDVRLKRRKVRSMNTQLVPALMAMMEKQVVDNNGYLVLRKLTWADIFFVGLIEYLSYVSEHNLIDDYPALRQHAHMVTRLRGIRQWIKIRPVTEV